MPAYGTTKELFCANTISFSAFILIILEVCGEWRASEYNWTYKVKKYAWYQHDVEFHVPYGTAAADKNFHYYHGVTTHRISGSIKSPFEVAVV